MLLWGTPTICQIYILLSEQVNQINVNQSHWIPIQLMGSHQSLYYLKQNAIMEKNRNPWIKFSIEF